MSKKNLIIFRGLIIDERRPPMLQIRTRDRRPHAFLRVLASIPQLNHALGGRLSSPQRSIAVISRRRRRRRQRRMRRERGRVSRRARPPIIRAIKRSNRTRVPRPDAKIRQLRIAAISRRAVIGRGRILKRSLHRRLTRGWTRRCVPVERVVIRPGRVVGVSISIPIARRAARRGAVAVVDAAARAARRRGIVELGTRRYGCGGAPARVHCGPGRLAG